MARLSGLVLTLLGVAYATNVFVDFHANQSVVGIPRIQPAFTTRLTNWLFANQQVAQIVAAFVLIGRKLFFQRRGQTSLVPGIVAGPVVRGLVLLIGLVIRLLVPGGSKTPEAAHVSRNGKAMLVQKDYKEANNTLFAPDSEWSTVSDSRNTHSPLWLETGSVITAEGRTFSYHRESVPPHEWEVKVIRNKSSAMNPTLEEYGTSLSARNKTSGLKRQ